MEKHKPHCLLSVVKSLINGGMVRITQSAVNGGRLLGFDEDGIIETVLALTPADFYKSMTTHVDNTIWQDVYRPSVPTGDVYLKLMVLDDVLIVSFKEL